MRAEEFVDNTTPFADGYLVASRHFLKDRSAQRNISIQQIQQILHRLETNRGEELARMPFVTFVVKSPSLGVAISKQQDKHGRTAYVVTTAHDNLKSGADQDVFYLEEEQLDELYFLGSKCTTDCSGHRAGYDWSSKRGDIDSASWSNSFNKGAHLRATGN
jgi:hypothetical protein